jgi:hypothetical protein
MQSLVMEHSRRILNFLTGHLPSDLIDVPLDPLTSAELILPTDLDPLAFETLRRVKCEFPPSMR